MVEIAVFRIRQRHVSLLNNALVFTDNGTEEEQGSLADQMWELSKCYASDKMIFFYSLEVIARLSPSFLLSILDELPSMEEEDILQIGVFIKDPENRKSFCEHFEIEAQKLEKAVIERENNNLLFQDPVGDGVCYGFTLAKIIDPKAFPTDLLPRVRFLQRTHEFSFALPYADIDGIGAKILSSPQIYPETLSAICSLLGYENTDGLLAAYQDQDQRSVIQRTVGKIAFRGEVINKKLLLQKEKLEQEDHLLGDMTEQLLKLQKKEDIEALEQMSLQISTKILSINTELDDLAILLETHLLPLPEDFPLPHSLLKKHHLQKHEPIYMNRPIKQLSRELQALTLPVKEGAFELSLVSQNGSGHAIYLSFNPLSFSDINDINRVTGEPNLRKFETREEMLDALEQMLLIVYSKNHWKSFSLTFYEKINVEETQSAPLLEESTG